MNNQKTTIKEATQKWVKEFNSIEQSLIKRAFKNDIDNWIELTKPCKGSYVWSDNLQGSYEVLRIKEDEGIVILEGEEKTDIDDIYLEPNTWLPMWGWMWTCGESFDEDWIRDNLQIVSECGFRIFEDDKTGTIYLGIDGAGYDFYEAHWIPLYKARGLKWHDIEE